MTPEEGVIGACLLDPGVIRFAKQHVMPSDFGSWQGEEIFTAICWLEAARQPVDVITVQARLAEMGSRVSAADLHNAVAQVPSSSAVEFYAAEVREGAMRRRLRAIATSLAGQADNEVAPPGEVLAEAMRQLKAARDDSPTNGLPVEYLEDVMAKKDAAYDWVIANLFERGDRLILTGPEGGGKSMLMRQIAIFSAAGIHPFNFGPMPAVKVLVVDRENSERQWRRNARALFTQATTIGNIAGNLALSCEPRPLDLTRDQDLGKVHRLLDEHPADLLVIGPLYKLSPRALQTDDEAGPVFRALDSLRERGCALVMEAHAGHNRTADLHPRGSSAILGWPEFGKGLRRDQNDPYKFALEDWRGDREPRDFPKVLLRGKGITWVPEGTSEILLTRFRNALQAEQTMGF